MTAAEFSVGLFDPRGRMSRKGFLAASLAILALEILGSLLIFKVGLAPDGAVITGLKIIVAWLCFTALAKRLHDVGYSAWWLLGMIAAVAIWVAVFVSSFLAIGGLDAVRPGSVGSYLLYAGAMAPALGLVFWLQLAKGDLGFNAFGVEPDSTGFGAPEQKRAPAYSLSQPVRH